MDFKLVSSFKPTGDQPQAVEKLISGLEQGYKDQVLLGVTGSGKTFTMASVIEKINKPTLIISHNKTLAGQLYQEFRDFFPQNCVSYFVSYYDYYQPEAYIPQTDTYLEKETQINDLIDKLRLAATTNLLTRKDTIIVASVSAIYNLGSPQEYGNYVLQLKLDQKIDRKELFLQLDQLRYERSDYDFRRGTYRVRGETIDLYPAYEDFGYRINFDEHMIKNMMKLDPISGQILNTKYQILNTINVYPAKHYMTDPNILKSVLPQIEEDLKIQIDKFKKEGKIIEAQRIKERVNYDLEMIKTVGFVNGIENYSRYFDGRKPGDPPCSLLEYFRQPYDNDWLTFIDESHMTVPQLNGMYNGDRSRKETLINFGFRLPAALDNRPLKFAELLPRLSQTVYVSATPSPWELSKADQVVEQLVRPTGLIDPQIMIKPIKDQIQDLILEIIRRVEKGERVLVTTLTKRMAEDLADYLKELPSSVIARSGTTKQSPRKDDEIATTPFGLAMTPVKVAYLHSDVETLDRQDILEDLRKGNYDVLVGINLLREGLDLPEVSLVAILDADKEGFLRSEISLIQTMGRAARHINGTVILYADKVTGSMERAIKEINRRRQIQINYNQKNKITPVSISKPIREKLIEREELASKDQVFENDPDQLTPEDRKKLAKTLKKMMNEAGKNLDFELAAKLRDRIKKLSKD